MISRTQNTEHIVHIDDDELLLNLCLTMYVCGGGTRLLHNNVIYVEFGHIHTPKKKQLRKYAQHLAPAVAPV